MAKSTEATGNTTPRQFRLKDDTLAHLDFIAEELAKTTGRENSRADAIRYAAKEIAARLRKKLSR